MHPSRKLDCTYCVYLLAPQDTITCLYHRREAPFRGSDMRTWNSSWMKVGGAASGSWLCCSLPPLLGCEVVACCPDCIRCWFCCCCCCSAADEGVAGVPNLALASFSSSSEHSFNR